MTRDWDLSALVKSITLTDRATDGDTCYDGRQRHTAMNYFECMRKVITNQTRALRKKNKSSAAAWKTGRQFGASI